MAGPIRGAALTVFWAAAGTIAATYVLFPAAILVRGRLLRRPLTIADATRDATPAVTVIIAAYNEERSIGAKLANLIAADYPTDRRQILVASDGSDDTTNAVVRTFADRGVRLLALPRGGKAAALNAALAEATGDIVVFSDANSMFVPDAIRAIVRPFADPSVGGVAGDQRYLRGGASGAMAEGERGYWDLDRMLKRAESQSGNVISATGAIYAVRRELIPPVPDGVTDDFVTSTAVVAAGRRLVFAEGAAAYEPVASSGGVEYGRKVRVMTRGLRGVLLRRALLDPRRTGFYAFQLLWHKLLRRLMVLPLIGLAISSPLLVGAGPFYRLAAAGQALFYGLAAAGIALRGRPISKARPLAFPAFFCLVNLAALHAAINVVRGHRIDRWEPQRPTDRPSAESGEPVEPAMPVGSAGPAESSEPSEPVPVPDAAAERVA
jgi:cellulose synthase/poly-beta-1,6-N-acetylglucosamine synthase-like glycosyltransferase